MYTTNCSLFKLLLLLIFASSNLPTSRSSCVPDCGVVKIPFPFGVGKNCYLDKAYEIECGRKSPTSRELVPFLAGIKKEVVSISLPNDVVYHDSRLVGQIRVREEITSIGCSTDGKDSGSVLNLTGTPFFIDGINNLVAVGCNSKVSLTHIKRNLVGCELKCNASKVSRSNTIPFFDQTGCWSNMLTYSDYEVCTESNPEDERCDGDNGCCEASLPNDPQQVVGVKIESNDGNRTTGERCQVAFLTDEFYSLSNVTTSKRLFAQGDATVSLRWVIQTNNSSFLNSLACKSKQEFGEYYDELKTKCICDQSTISEITYANCACNNGYKGNPYIPDGCVDINECESQIQRCSGIATCENSQGSYHCGVGKIVPITIAVGTAFGVLVLVGGVWWLRKFLIKRRITKRKKLFFKRNGGLLLQQELNTKEGNVEKTIIFSSRELEKSTENFSTNRVLGQGGQGTVYKGMLVDGRTVAVKKSKVIDEDKLQEFINEVVILSQINHRHVVKLLGCCLETEVPILVYEFILNGNLFQHIHEESDDYTMIWGVRLRIAVDIAGALSYLHSSASSPIYHRDIKSTNILLDEKYRAKVSDFGTSRSITIDQTHWTTVISGTVGYVDPEYYQSSQYTEKSDVYSFGVILAELITGEKPVIMVQNSQEIMSLAAHFKLAMKEGRFSDIMDSRIRDDCKPEQVKAVANLAMKCLNSKGKNRPNMRQVFTELERICASPDDSQVHIQIDEEEEEVMKIIDRSDSWSIGGTAHALALSSSSSSDIEPLFPRLTW